MRVLTRYGKTKSRPHGRDDAITLRVDGSGSEYTRRRVNLVAGTGMTITIADIDTTDEIDATFDSTGGGGLTDGDYGDVVVSGSGTALTVDNDAITYAKFQNVTTNRLLGRATAGAGDVEEITLGTGLSFTGTTLNAAIGDINSLTAADPAHDDTFPFYDTSATANRKANLSYLLALAPPIAQGRLTVTSGEPVNITTGSTVNTIYYEPYVGNAIALWDGTRWVVVQFTGVALALGTLTAMTGYDVFAYLNSGALALELLAWSSGTARATAITLQDGRYCKSGDKTRLYLGSFLAISTTATVDVDFESGTNYGRHVWNMYNRVETHMAFQATSNSWSYPTATYRQWPNNAAEQSKCYFFRGLNEEPMELQFFSATSATAARPGIGLDRTNAQDATIFPARGDLTQVTTYRGRPGLGLHYLAPLEYATTTCTWYGDDNTTVIKAGWVARLKI